MAWMKYNKETKKVARAAVLVSDLEKFDSIVMDNATWSAINTFSITYMKICCYRKFLHIR